MAHHQTTRTDLQFGVGGEKIEREVIQQLGTDFYPIYILD